MTEKPEGGIINKISSEFSFVKGNFKLLMVSWLRTRGTATSVGLVMSAEIFARALAQIPGGYITDKYGRKWIIVSMTLLAGISRIIYILAPNWQWLVVGSAIMGFTGIDGPAIEAMIADSIPAEKRGMGFGLVSLIGGVATTPSPLIAGFMFLRLGLIPTMRISYVLTLAALMVASFIRLQLKETLENPRR